MFRTYALSLSKTLANTLTLTLTGTLFVGCGGPTNSPELEESTTSLIAHLVPEVLVPCDTCRTVEGPGEISMAAVVHETERSILSYKVDGRDSAEIGGLWDLSDGTVAIRYSTRSEPIEIHAQDGVLTSSILPRSEIRKVGNKLYFSMNREALDDAAGSPQDGAGFGDISASLLPPMTDLGAITLEAGWSKDEIDYALASLAIGM